MMAVRPPVSEMRASGTSIPFKDHVNVGFFRGSTLSDPGGLMQGTGKLGRHVKLFPFTPVSNPRALEALITEAYRDIKACLRTE